MRTVDELVGLLGHAQHLAQVIDSKEAAKLQELLSGKGIEAFAVQRPRFAEEVCKFPRPGLAA